MQTFETIRTRLQLQTANRFGRNTDTLPQETRLFIDWMASELSTLHRELQRSNDAIHNRILQRLTPDVQTRPLPTYAIAYAQPRQHGYVLRPDEDVLTLPRLGQAPPHQIFYAPLLPMPMVKGKVKFLAAGRSLVEIVEHNTHQVRSTVRVGASFHPGVLWVGIEWNAPVPIHQSLCFHVDWKIDQTSRKQELYDLLPLVAWQHGDKTLTVEPGIQFEQKLADRYAPNFVDEEFLHLYKIEKNILQHYNLNFLSLPLQGASKSALPVEIAEKFDEETLKEHIKEELIWFKLIFPAGFTPAEIQQTSLQLNCFPVLNRRLDRTRDFTPTNSGGTEIIALSNADRGRAALSDMGTYFLGIQRIFTRDTSYRPVIFDQFRQASVGYYALQRGRVEADDFRDLYARINELSHLLRTHTSTLTLLPQHTVNQALANIENGAESLEAALRQVPPKDIDLGYYLHLKVLDPQDMIYVRFWITQGEYAQGVGAPGDLMTAERGAVLEGDVGWVVG